MDIKKQVANIQQSAISDPRFKKYDEDLQITDQALEGVNKLFNSILPHFPAWRNACPTDDDLSRLKLVWTKALMRNKQKTGKNLNLKAGIAACEESDTDFLPSVGKFMKLCDQENDLVQFADRAYQLFINREKQIDNIGQTVVGKHAFHLRKMEASKSKKAFTDYYLEYAEETPITTLDAFSLTDGVTLSKEQQIDAQKRTDTAQADCMSKIKSQLNIK